MGLFYIPPSSPYLETIAEYLINDIKQSHINKDLQGYNFTEYIVYLPNYKACRYLQEIIITKVNVAVVLPTIKTFFDQDLVTTDLTNSMLFWQTSTTLEQELMLANIIKSYPKFKYSLSQALGLSRDLGKLFKEFTLNNLDLQKINEIYSGDYAEHWLDIQEFLIYSKHEWQSYLAGHNKIDQAAAYQLSVEEKIANLNNSDKQIIIAGFLPDNQLLQKLYKTVFDLANVKLILPPLAYELVANFWDKIADHNNLQYLQKLLKYCQIKISDIQPLSAVVAYPKIEYNRSTARQKCLFNIFFSTKTSVRLPVEGIIGLQYIPVANQIEESALIAVIVKYYSDYEPSSRIAIVTENQNLIKKIAIFLTRFGLQLERRGAQKLIDLKAAEFLIALFKMVESKFKPCQILNFMKHTYFCCDEVHVLEKTILRQSSYSGLELLQDKLRHDDKLAFWFENLLQKLQPLINLTKSNYCEFNVVLVTLIRVAENICSDLWQQNDGPLVEFLSDLIDKSVVLEQIELKDFSSIFQLLLTNQRVESATNWQPKLFIAAPNELDFITKVDYLILADLNDNSWPKTPIVDPWISDRMRGALGLEKKSAKIVKDLQYFFNALHCRNVFLTRALKIEGTETLASRFLLKLLSKLDTQELSKHLEPDIDWLSVVKEILLPDKAITKLVPSYKAIKAHFPKKIAVTYLELLMRNPHAFYAKKILKLEKLSQVVIEPGAREFGIFIHDVFEYYVKNYHFLMLDKAAEILEIGKSIIKRDNISELTAAIWWPKFKNIAKEFVIYDQKKRDLKYEIHTEIQGNSMITIEGCNITLTAKADRIEVQKNGEINIIDFKTGILPTSKDIEMGLSPQLLIEYFILYNGGFENIRKCPEITLSYIKLASNKPYLRENKLKINLDIHSFTAEGITKLLKFFIQEEVNYLACPNKSYAPKYNDYKHLARLE